MMEHRDEHGRPGLIVVPNANRAGGRGTRILLHTRGGDVIDLSEHVLRVETTIEVGEADKHRVTFIAGVLPEFDGT